MKIKKTESDAEWDGNTLKVKLSHADTFKLNHRWPVKIQLRVKTKLGKALRCDVGTKSVSECLDREVL